MHALGSWCERYRSGTGARQSDRSGPLDKTPLRAPTIFRTLAPRSLPAPLRSHALLPALFEYVFSFAIAVMTQRKFLRCSYASHINKFITCPSLPITNFHYTSTFLFCSQQTQKKMCLHTNMNLIFTQL